MTNRMRHLSNFSVALVGVLIVLVLSHHAKAIAGDIPKLVTVPAGSFIMGSDQQEKEIAYKLDEAAYGHSVTRDRGWYDGEVQRSVVLDAFNITQTPITNKAYAAFIADTGHRLPSVGKVEWDGYGLIHPFSRAQPYIWTSNQPPADRENHPVVLVSYDDALAYADWLSTKTGQNWRLPTQEEWEKAARGAQGAYFPWDNTYDPNLLNSHDAGPFSTMPVGSFPAGASPYGLLDAAGQVFEWTSTPNGKARRMVKGGSWDDRGCGVCRPAARHGRPEKIKHILVGFRLVQE